MKRRRARQYSITGTGLVAVALVLMCVSSARAAPVMLDGAISSRNISRFIEYREDPSGTLTLTQVRNAAGASAWKSNDRDYLNFGYTTSAYWFRFVVANRKAINDRLLLEVDFSSLDHVDFFFPDGRGGYDSIRTGDLVRFDARKIIDRNFLFPLVQGQGTDAYYLRVANLGSLRFQARLYSGRALLESRVRILPLAWFLYGMILLTSVFYLFMFAFIRDRSYLYFSLLTLCMFMHQVALRGFAFQYVWPAWPWLNRVVIPSAMNGMAIFSALFISTILDLRSTNRHIHRGFRLFALVVFPALEVGVFFLSYRAAALAIYYSLLAYGVFFIPSMVYYFFKGNRFARYFVPGGIVLVLTNFISTFAALGRLPVVPAMEWSNEMGQLLLVIFSSVGLVDRFWNMNREIADSERFLQEKNVVLARANEDLRKSLGEESLLLRDVHDRVKNNLQIMSSLLNLQIGALGDSEAARALADTVARIHSMAGIHEMIYRGESYARVDMGSYVEDLSRRLAARHTGTNEARVPIRVVSPLSRVYLPLDRAMPGCLLINELLGIALTQGRGSAEESVIELGMKCDGDVLTIVVADNGSGMRRELFDCGSVSTIGTQVIDVLSRQVGATIELEAGSTSRVTVKISGCLREAG